MAITEPSGGLPELAAAEEDKWHSLIIQCSTLDEIDDAGPNKKWNAYICDAEFNGEDIEEFEICFWAQKAFWAVFAEAGKPKKGTLEMKYKRKVKGEKSFATFQVVE